MAGTVIMATEEGAVASTEEAPEPATPAPPAVQHVEEEVEVVLPPATSSTTTEIPHDTASTELTIPVTSSNAAGALDDANPILCDGDDQGGPPATPHSTSSCPIAESSPPTEAVKETDVETSQVARLYSGGPLALIRRPSWRSTSRGRSISRSRRSSVCRSSSGEYQYRYSRSLSASSSDSRPRSKQAVRSASRVSSKSRKRSSSRARLSSKPRSSSRAPSALIEQVSRRSLRKWTWQQIPKDTSKVPAEPPSESHSNMATRAGRLEYNWFPRVRQRSPSPTRDIIAELNRIPWETFLYRSSILERYGSLYVIDVLVEEPQIDGFDEPVTYRLAEAIKRTSSWAKDYDCLVPKTRPMPERIRISSPSIAAILDSLTMDGIDTTHSSLSHREGKSGGRSGFIMLRPFRALAYMKRQLFELYGDLILKSRTEPKTAPDKPQNHEPKAGKIDPNAGEVSSSSANREATETEPTSTNDPSQPPQNEPTADDTKFKHLKCLIEFMKVDIDERIDYLNSPRCERATFFDLWYLFKPGDEVIDHDENQAYHVLGVLGPYHQTPEPALGRFSDADYDIKASMSISCVYIDFDGDRLGPVSITFEIPKYDGEKPVTSLPVYPLRFAGRKSNNSDENVGDKFRQRLIGRGRKFMEYTRITHGYYSGYTLDTNEEVDSDVIIDPEQAFSSPGQGNWKPVLENLIQNKPKEKSRVAAPSCSAVCCRGEEVYPDAEIDTLRNKEYMASLIPKKRYTDPSLIICPRPVHTYSMPALTENSTSNRKEFPTNGELVVMSSRVFGYILRLRKWGKLNIDFFDPIETADRSIGMKGETTQEQKTSFDHLVLPYGHKEMVLSLIAQHFRDKAKRGSDVNHRDIVRGKGKGLIILLHGAPGLGKTTTAEGVAAHFKKPLFQITCGDLGTQSKDVEAALERHFALASRWGCILLLDEADVFLASRTPQDLARNGLVSVFLRVLEYYNGVLFLTTNRIGDFDEAFASRVHVSLYYPHLDLQSTQKIFELNLERIRKQFQQKNRAIAIDKDKIMQFISMHWESKDRMRWNGRQIRNACQTALALAEFEAQGGNFERVVDANAEIKLTRKHIKTVSKSYREFNHYLERVYDRDLDRRAKYMGIRARDDADTSCPPGTGKPDALDSDSDDDPGNGPKSSFGYFSQASLHSFPTHPQGFQPHLFNTQTGQHYGQPHTPAHPQMPGQSHTLQHPMPTYAHGSYTSTHVALTQESGSGSTYPQAASYTGYAQQTPNASTFQGHMQRTPNAPQPTPSPQPSAPQGTAGLMAMQASPPPMQTGAPRPAGDGMGAQQSAAHILYSQAYAQQHQSPYGQVSPMSPAQTVSGIPQTITGPESTLGPQLASANLLGITGTQAAQLQQQNMAAFQTQSWHGQLTVNSTGQAQTQTLQGQQSGQPQ